MDTDELIRRKIDKQKEILKTLKPELLAEFLRLQSEIGAIQKLVTDEKQEELPPPFTGFLKATPRIPLLNHKRALILFFSQCKRPVSRKQILAATSIPGGSLSSLLKAKEFKQVGHGMWALREGAPST